MYVLSGEQYSIISISMVLYFQTSYKLKDFAPKVSQLYTRIVTQGETEPNMLCQIKKAFQRHADETFSKYCKT